jgi:alpha/beta superfamily hydrolase
MDDYIVQSISSVLLDLGFVVGLFNFRGAGGGKGHTSWTGKAETADYKSFVIWMAEFLESLEGWAREDGAEEGDKSAAVGGHGDVQGVKSQATATKDTLLITSGYSYGSLITTLLPPLPALLTPPASTTQLPSSPYSEILLRAQHLAGLQNEVLRTTRRPEAHRQKDLEVRWGGDEDIRRVSREQKRSLDWSRKSVDRIRGSFDVVRSISARRGESRSEPIPEQRPTMDQEDDEQQANAAAPSSEVVPDDIDTAYLLISPLRGIARSLLQPSSLPSALLPSFLSLKRKSLAPMNEDTNKFMSHPTLAIYGDSDHFSSLSKQRSWVLEMEGAEGSKFHALEVEGAGHFWHGAGEVEGLKRVVKGWAEDLCSDEAVEGS